MIRQLCFHYAEKRFGHRIVPTISLSGHALNKTLLVEFFSEICARILNATIRMKNKPFEGSSAPDRPLERRNHHLMAQRTAQGPADHQTRKQINDYRQVQPTRAGGQVRVSSPEESHLQALSEPGVNLSAHRAPIVPVDGTKPARQCGNKNL